MPCYGLEPRLQKGAPAESDSASEQIVRPSVSVVVFARESVSSIREALSSLAAQQGIERAEVIVADASDDGTSEIVEREFPWVRHLVLGPCTMPQGKAAAIEASRAGIVAILDVGDRAEPGWLAYIEQELGAEQGSPDVVQAIGGEVLFSGPLAGANGPGYLFEYGAFAPDLVDGSTAGDLPGNNVAYRRRVFDETCASMLGSGFYKPFFHARIRSAGGELHIRSRMRVRHHVRIGLMAFCRRRFHYGRCFGAMRVREAARSRRLLYVVFVPVVPLLLLGRHVFRALRHPTNRRLLARSLPGLVLLCFAWGVGESLGTWFGAGRSCRMVY